MAKELQIANQLLVETHEIEARLIELRGKKVLIDRDVAELYGVETKRVNEAVKNNPDKFPRGISSHYKDLRNSNWSKISTTSRP